MLRLEEQQRKKKTERACVWVSCTERSKNLCTQQKNQKNMCRIAVMILRNFIHMHYINIHFMLFSTIPSSLFSVVCFFFPFNSLSSSSLFIFPFRQNVHFSRLTLMCGAQWIHVWYPFELCINTLTATAVPQLWHAFHFYTIPCVFFSLLCDLDIDFTNTTTAFSNKKRSIGY